MNSDEIEKFLAGRKAAGRVIDIENCNVVTLHVDVLDPYGIYGEPAQCLGSFTFVASAESGGWVLEEDLPDDKYRALQARAARGDFMDVFPF
jgi:hypothetical protein